MQKCTIIIDLLNATQSDYASHVNRRQFKRPIHCIVSVEVCGDLYESLARLLKSTEVKKISIHAPSARSLLLFELTSSQNKRPAAYMPANDANDPPELRLCAYLWMKSTSSQVNTTLVIASIKRALAQWLFALGSLFFACDAASLVHSCVLVQGIGNFGSVCLI